MEFIVIEPEEDTITNFELKSNIDSKMSQLLLLDKMKEASNSIIKGKEYNSGKAIKKSEGEEFTLLFQNDENKSYNSNRGRITSSSNHNFVNIDPTEDDDDDDDGDDEVVDDRIIVDRRLPLNKFNRNQNNGQIFSEITEKLEHDKTNPTGMTRRCACNLSQCASTNYMCKSEKRTTAKDDGSSETSEAGCFVEELNANTLENLSQGASFTEANGKVTSARRGCVEMLSRDKLKLCSDRPGSGIHCCFDEDMCNYPKTFYPPQIRSPASQYNSISYDSSNSAISPNIDQQVWLRAALLTIPVFGIIILIILIVFARRMLKNDTKDKEARLPRHNRRNHNNTNNSSKHCNNHNHNNSCNNSSPNNINNYSTQVHNNSSSCPLVKPIFVEPVYHEQHETN